MKGPPSNKISYSILTDPHMVYYLRTPQRVNDLLKSDLFYLQNNHIIEKKTKLTFKL